VATRERVDKGSIQDDLNQSQGADFDSMTGTTDMALHDAEPAKPAQGVVYHADADFDDGDTALPRLRLAQGLTAEVQSGEAKPGQWVLSGYDAENEVVIIPLMRAKYRNRRDRDNNILCSSPDAVTGYGNPGGNCETCPNANWKQGNAPAAERAPDCDLVMGYGAWSVTHEQLIAVNFQKTGIQTAQLVNTILKSKGMGNVAIKLSAEGKQNGNRIYHKPRAIIAKGVSQEDFDMAKEMAGMAKSRAEAGDLIDSGDVIDAQPVSATSA
jgi:hypothetical protein